MLGCNRSWMDAALLMILTPNPLPVFLVCLAAPGSRGALCPRAMSVRTSVMVTPTVCCTTSAPRWARRQVLVNCFHFSVGHINNRQRRETVLRSLDCHLPVRAAYLSQESIFAYVIIHTITRASICLPSITASLENSVLPLLCSSSCVDVMQGHDNLGLCMKA